MIRTQTQVPSNYYSRSRDFQLMGRLFDIVFNSSKEYADGVGRDSNARMLGLRADTVGFRPKAEYDSNDLISVCECFKSIMRKKGSREAIESCIILMLRSQGLDERYSVNIVNSAYDGDGHRSDVYEITVLVPQELRDVALLNDLLDYVLPAGYLCNILVGTIPGNTYGEVDAQVTVSAACGSYADGDLGIVYDKSTDDMTSHETNFSTVYQPTTDTN